MLSTTACLRASQDTWPNGAFQESQRTGRSHLRRQRSETMSASENVLSRSILYTVLACGGCVSELLCCITLVGKQSALGPQKLFRLVQWMCTRPRQACIGSSCPLSPASSPSNGCECCMSSRGPLCSCHTMPDAHNTR
ncbi:hypothetical protein BCV70DRAFT_27965 [Testicularia cyperi]|uniref:Uncharacterized protein n=1 Tax=Testicularia cyperi TaxID=1882483 RepID=A0A317XNB4_9BASI|nr:hypothetical protein BCV70DRAFT_27965 [Testicularia cyperi]